MPAMPSRWARRRLRSRSPRMPTAGRWRAARSGRRRLRSPPGSARAMKLASLKARPDGQLVVVSRDLARCTPAEGIAPTLQAALESWAAAEPRLRALADDLEAGRVEARPFDQAACASPLPRAYQWLDGSAYVTHVELVRKARGAELPERFWSDPLMYQGASDGFLGPRDPIEAAGEDWGIDLESEVAVITDRVPMGTPAARAGDHVKARAAGQRR